MSQAGQVISLPIARSTPFDPADELGRLRRDGGMTPLRYRDRSVGWLVTGHALAKVVLADSRFGVHPARPTPVADPERYAAVHAALASVGAAAGDLLELDAPRHTHLRRLIAAPLAVARVEDLRGGIERIVADRLDALERAGPPVDLLARFAIPVALQVHCLLLGVPHEDEARFARLHDVLVDPTSTAHHAVAELRPFARYVRGVLERKRTGDDDDLISHIAKAPDITEDEAFGLVLTLFLSGHDTTATMVALGTLVLLQDPVARDGLREDSRRIDGAVEELLRYLTIFQVGSFTRVAREDVTLGSVTIREGDSVTVSFAAANRDPEQFDRPDELDLTRRARGHLAFGHGGHMCVGQHLARVEIQVAIQRLLERFPSLRLASGRLGDVPFLSEEHLVYGVRELRVAW